MMSGETSLVPVEERVVTFYDDQLIAVRLEDGSIQVPLRHLCELLGIDWSAQRQRVNRDPVLSRKVGFVVVTPTNPSTGGNPNMLCMPLEYLNGWLFGISANRVKPVLRDRIIRYQEECYRVLAEAFQEGRLTADPTFDVLLQQDTPEVQAYQMALAVMKLARQQILLRADVERHDFQLQEHDQRLEAVEAELGKGERFITKSQAMEISQAVKAVALELGKRSKKNEFGGVYGELYRVFGIPSYRELPASQFDEAIAFMNEWLQSMISDSPF
jgi:hypothetical protein